MRPVSTSEAGDMGKCETLWKFKYHPDYRLQTLSDGPAVTRGLLGHKALENYFIKIKEGVSHEEASKWVIDSLMNALLHYMQKEGDAEKAAVHGEMAKLLSLYFEFYGDPTLEWEILEVEGKVEDPTFGFVGRLDLLIRYKKGPHVGKVAIVDHKFLYNFWHEKLYRVAAAGPNYLRAVKFMFPEYDVDHMLYNAIRFRPDAKDTFDRKELPWQKVKHLAMNANHEIYVERARRYSQLSKKEADVQIPRSFLKDTCNYCGFLDLCTAQLEGTNTDLMERVSFRPNTYGYTDSDE
jgi:hypothetical protein